MGGIRERLPVLILEAGATWVKRRLHELQLGFVPHFLKTEAEDVL